MNKQEFQTENQKLNEAIIFATEHHSGQLRKATAIPYILHPLEVLSILYSMRADTNLMIAGGLHDTVEDTDATMDDIRENFGDDVARLVAANSEDKSKSWQERKAHTITELGKSDKRVKMLVLADKLSNMRSIAHDYEKIGDELWKRFNAPKEKQAWYYGGLQDALFSMQLYPECAQSYWEFVSRYKDVFVHFYHDKEKEILYQLCDDGTGFCLNRGNPCWVPLETISPQEIAKEIVKDDKMHYFKVDSNFENTVQISRQNAELLEDEWNKSALSENKYKC